MAVPVAEKSSDIPEYLGSEQKQVSDYTLSPLIATEREKRREETESLSLLVFESYENVISKIFRSSIIQDGFLKTFVTSFLQNTSEEFHRIWREWERKRMEGKVWPGSTCRSWEQPGLSILMKNASGVSGYTMSCTPCVQRCQTAGQIQGGKEQTANGRPAKAPVSPGNEEAVSEAILQWLRCGIYHWIHTGCAPHFSPRTPQQSSLLSVQILPPTALHPALQCCAAFPQRPRDAPAARDTPVPSGDLNVLFSPGWDKPAQPVTAPRAGNRWNIGVRRWLRENNWETVIFLLNIKARN